MREKATIFFMVSIDMLTKGGAKWEDRLEDSLRRSGISWRAYTCNRISATRRLISQRLLMPLYIDLTLSYGERWGQLFRFIANTDEHQTVDIVRNLLFPYIRNSRVAKKGNLPSVGKWDGKLSVREAIEAKLKNFTLETVQGAYDIPVGFGFSGAIANSHEKVTTPYNWLRGRKMYAFLKDQLELEYTPEQKQFIITLQIGREDRMFEIGIRVFAKVPSFRGDEKPHNIVISNLPIYSRGQGIPEAAKRRGYDVFVQDDCKRNFFSDDKFGRKRPYVIGEETRNENELDHHFVLVVEAASGLISRQYPELAVDNPIPKMPEGVEDLVEAAFKRIRILEPSKNRATMLWKSTNLMQVYTMMAVAYLNSKRLAENRA